MNGFQYEIARTAWQAFWESPCSAGRRTKYPGTTFDDLEYEEQRAWLQTAVAVLESVARIGEIGL